MKKLSIISVCKNDALNLEKTILSIINQTYENYEYIIIDGASSDNTEEIISKYKNYINIYITEPDLGIFNAQNKGINFSKGEYLCFLNAGDFFSNPYTLEKVFDSKQEADIIYGDINYKFSNGFVYRKKSFKKLTQFKFLVESLPHPSCFIRKTVFEKVGLMDETYKISSDYEFFLRAILKFSCSTKYVSIPIAVFNLEGLSSKFEHSYSAKVERKQAQKKYINPKIIGIFSFFRLPTLLFLKKLRYLIYLLISLINRNFTHTN